MAVTEPMDLDADPVVRDRILGGLLGVACGDALGATTEFEPGPRPADRRVTEIEGGGAFGWRPGQPTDDTDLTIAVLRAYVARDGVPVSSDEVVAGAASGFVAWYLGRPRDIGVTTARSLRALQGGTPPTASGVADADAQANGSLMRCLPTGLARSEVGVRRDEAARLSAVTHASPVCVDACVAYLDIASALVDGAAATEARGAADGRPTATPQVDDALAVDPSAEIPWARGGWVLTALRLAVWAIQQDAPAADLLLDVINQGGDADTNGAIVGGLLGCRDGVTAWPPAWVDVLETRDELRAAADPLVALRHGA